MVLKKCNALWKTMGYIGWVVTIVFHLFVVINGKPNPSNSHHKDWQAIVSHYAPNWKNQSNQLSTEGALDSTHLQSSPDVELSQASSETSTSVLHTTNLRLFTTNLHTSFSKEVILQSDAKMNSDVNGNFTTFLVLVISLPIIGIILLCCCCYGIIRCCCSSSSKPGNIIIMQNPHTTAPQQPTQINVQEPVYNMPPPQQYLPPPYNTVAQEHEAMQSHPWDVPAHYHNGGGVVQNPNYIPPPTAPPPQYISEKY